MGRSPASQGPLATLPDVGGRTRTAAALGLVLAGGLGLPACSSSGTTAAPASARVLVALPLRVDAAGLTKLADSVADPANSEFREFRTVADLAQTYGASSATIDHDEHVLRADGLHLAADPTRGALWGSVTPSQADRYFGVSLVDAGGVLEPSATPHVPPGMTGVDGLVGLDASKTIPSAGVTGGTATPPCSQPIPTRDSVASLFGFTGAAGQTGAGTTVDIISIHQFEPAVFTNYDRCTGQSITPDQITEASVPDTPSTSGGDEVALDTLMLSLLAPRTQVRVLNFDPVTSPAFPLMTLLEDGSTPDVLDITAAYCESQLPTPSLALSEWLFSAFAASGTTTVAAAGDTGSSGCHPSTNTAEVTYPASSRFVTSIGGVAYGGGASDPTDLRVWNEHGSAGGGGGVSRQVDAPPWQPAGKRRVPDLSAYAVPGGIGYIPVCQTASDCVWSAQGGTSVAATVLGATGILLAQQYAINGHPARWGNLAGDLWRTGSKAEGVTDVRSGANTTFTNSCCTAGPGYDTASGWGLFDPDHLQQTVVERGS